MECQSIKRSPPNSIYPLLDKTSDAVPRVLLVDDDPVLLQGLCDMLMFRLRPAVVVVQASSDNVVATVQDGHYDIVVCDLRMSRTNGLEVIRQIKTMNPAQRIILMTGCIEESIDEKAHQQGADAVLRKPLDRDEVVSIIRSLIELSHTASRSEREAAEGLPPRSRFADTGNEAESF